MTQIDLLTSDAQMAQSVAQAAQCPGLPRVRVVDPRGERLSMQGVQAALVHPHANSSAFVSRYVSAGIPVLLLVTKSCLPEHIYAAVQAGANHVLNSDGTVRGLEQVLRRVGSLIGRRVESAGAARVAQPAIASTERRALPHIVAIGASAGGPRAVAQVLAALPIGLQAAVVLVVHVEEGQDLGLAEFLRQRCRLPLDLATEGAVPAPGRVLLAAAGQHLQFDAAGRPGLVRREPQDLFCPSVDKLFGSLAQFRSGGVAALLTGMGDDGANGLLALRQAGWPTLAQDAASSAVYGMPRKAAELGAADALVPLQDIATVLLRLIAQMGLMRLDVLSTRAGGQFATTTRFTP